MPMASGGTPLSRSRRTTPACPASAARTRGVLPSSSSASSAAPYSISARATSVWPSRAATSRGGRAGRPRPVLEEQPDPFGVAGGGLPGEQVGLPWQGRIDGGSPAAINVRAVATWPSPRARASGGSPSGGVKLGSAPRSSSSATTSVRPSRAATQSGVKPTSSVPSTGTPASSSSSVTASLPAGGKIEERRVAGGVTRPWIRAVGEELPNPVDLSVARRVHQGRAAAVVSLRGRAGLEDERLRWLLGLLVRRWGRELPWHSAGTLAGGGRGEENATTGCDDQGEEEGLAEEPAGGGGEAVQAHGSRGRQVVGRGSKERRGGRTPRTVGSDCSSLPLRDAQKLIGSRFSFGASGVRRDLRNARSASL